MSDGTENLKMDAALSYFEKDGMEIDENWPETESPIEALFMGALRIYLEIHGQFDLKYPCGEDGAHESLLDGQGKYGEILITPQFPYGSGRFDFLCNFKDQNGSSHALVIECDGHEFHERTKEQAKKDRARDREVQKCGATIFRFTGSELHHGSFDCAAQVVEWALSKARAARANRPPTPAEREYAFMYFFTPENERPF